MTQTLPFSRRGILGGLVSSLALAACNPVRYAAPRAELAAEFAADSPARRAGANAWWAAFRDKRLDALIATGLRRNLDVQTAVATIREAQANAQLIGASDLPQVDVQGSAARSRSETGIVETNSATLGVSWLVDLFGSTRAARQGASARLDAAYLSAEVARLTGFVRRWVEELVERYNRFGPASLGDRRRGNGAKPKILTPEVLATLRERVQSPPDDGGVWTAKKAAAVMAVELGLASVVAQRGWEALRAIGWTIQRPRPQHARAATPKEQEAFKKTSPKPSPRRRRAIPARSARSSPPTSTVSR